MNKNKLLKPLQKLAALMLLLVLSSSTVWAQNYCKIKGVNSTTRKLWIEEVSLGNLQNVSGNNNGYADFTLISFAVNAGDSVPFTVKTGRLLFKSKFYAKIYADFNQDGDFSDSGEIVYQDTANAQVSGFIKIPSTAASGNVRVRITTKRQGFAPDCGSYFLGETEDYTLKITALICPASAGTLTAVNSSICSNGATLTATPNGNAIVPSGFSTLYVLTSGTGLVIEQVAATPSFTVTGSGLYTIHTLVYDSTLNLGIVVPGVTTGFDVNSLLIQGGGSICASLDVAGAQFNVTNPDAGTLTAVNSTICGNGGTLTATPNGDANVPAGYSTLYVLTSGTGLVIEQVAATPSFTVTGSGLYTIHTLVYDSTLNLGIVVPGVTTGFDVNGLLVQGGGSVCASLDVAGAQFNVATPSAGTIAPDQFINCLQGGSAQLTGNPAGNASVPAGYQTVYVLTRGTGLVIQQAGPTPNFTVTQPGLYRIHTLVYDPATLNLGIVVPGVTTGFDVNSLLVQGGGSICASLDVQGAPFLVFGSFICNFFGINNSIVLPSTADDLTDEIVRLAETSNEGGLIIDNMFPVPASDELNVRYFTSTSENTTLRIISLDGKTVYSERFADQEGLVTRTIAISSIPAGTYLLRMENGQQVQTGKFEIIR